VKTVQPRKQHKMLYNMPAHRRGKLFSAALSASLKMTHQVNAVPLRTGDTVRIMRGDKKGTEGKISRVDRKKIRIFVEGVTREKVDGTAIQFPIHPSKVMITNLNLDDKWRVESLKAKASKEVEKPVEEKKPEAKKEGRRRTSRKAAAAEKGEKPKAPTRRRAKAPAKAEAEETEKSGEVESG
jgi:large subunit ribosomal protein L24